MRYLYPRFSLGRMMLGLAVVAVLLALFVPVGRMRHYHSLRTQTDGMLRTLRYRVPRGIDPWAWESAWILTVNAHGNICYSEREVSIEEMYRLRDDFSAKFRGPIGTETLVWIWCRLARTGPDGQRYVSWHKVALEDCLPPGKIVWPDDCDGRPDAGGSAR